MRGSFIIIGFVLLLVFAVCIGCQNQPPTAYGNFAEVEAVELVQDAMYALQQHYPPAKTRLALVQETGDAFGSALIETMRVNGYAVAEYVGPSRKDKYLSIVKKPDGLPFAYVIDRIDGGDQLRVSLHIGDETLGCVYRVQRSSDETRIVSQGFWTVKQGGNDYVR